MIWMSNVFTNILCLFTHQNGEGDGTILVWFTLLGKPPVKPSNSAPPPPPSPSPENDLKKAVEDLKKAVMAGGLTATWKNPSE